MDRPMKRVRLIVNGDDFGASPAVNEAVIRAHRQGILTACSLMVSGPAFDDAVRLAKANENLAVGIHLVAVMGRSVLPHSEIPSLVDTNGNFPSDPALAGLRYFFSRRSRREIFRELQAQFEKFASTGLPFSHIDSHLHLHVHPVLFEAAVELGEHYGVKRMRIPLDDYGLSSRFDGGGTFAGAAMAAIFRLLAARMKKRLHERGFTWARRGLRSFSQRAHEAKITSISSWTIWGKKRTRFISIPQPAAPRGNRYRHPPPRSSGEYEILVDPGVLSHVKKLGIELTHYRGIEPKR